MTCQPRPDCQINACRNLGICSRIAFLVVKPEEVQNKNFVRHVRLTTSKATQENGIAPSQMPDFLNDKYRDAKLKVINRNHVEVDLGMEHLEASDHDIDTDRAKKVLEDLREFFRNNAFNPPQGNRRVFVTQRWHLQFATMASVIGVSYPDQSRWWPRIINGDFVDPRVANDNRPPETR